MTSQSWSEDSTRVAHVAVLAVFSFLALLAVILRLWARRIQKNIWELSDYLVIVGLVRNEPVIFLRYLSDSKQIWSIAEAVFTIHCEFPIQSWTWRRIGFSLSAANIYWDLGGDLAQYGNPNAILRLVILQVKVRRYGSLEI